MYRQRMHDLIQLVESGKKPRLYLDGPRGGVLTSMSIPLASSHTADSHTTWPLYYGTLLLAASAGCISSSGRRVCTVSCAGGGKSIMMAMLAEWGRTSGRVVVYVPSASIFMDGGMYHK